MLKLVNTLSGKKELFKPLFDKVTMYVCGITPYERAHIGHGRCYVVFDVLYRLLNFLDYCVIYCRNFTDIDDKLFKKAEKEFGNVNRYPEIAERNIKSFHADMAALNCRTPDYEPRVTTHIPQIIDFIAALIKKGHAYQANGDVYFNISSFPSYGKLSRQKLDDLRRGVRIAVDEHKKDPLDFVLWKSEPTGQFWESPWGWGRPGWHIECSTLAREYLSDQIDLHGGGIDLIFPHHENEIAQSESLHQEAFTRYWIHNGLIMVDKEKMSKSLGNVFILEELFKQFDPMVLRYYFLNHHYRGPIDFAFTDLAAAQKAYQRLCNLFHKHVCADSKVIMELPIFKQLISFLYDDLNTAGMIGFIFEHLNYLRENEDALCAAKLLLTQVLGLTLKPLVKKKEYVTSEMKQLIDERNQAREQKNWARADTIRDQLKELGVEVHDEKIEKK
ncbi:MAG: cysteine--tRNA ligase [Candidatus Babeliales bacterium]